MALQSCPKDGKVRFLSVEYHMTELCDSLMSVWIFYPCQMVTVCRGLMLILSSNFSITSPPISFNLSYQYFADLLVYIRYDITKSFQNACFFEAALCYSINVFLCLMMEKCILHGCIQSDLYIETIIFYTLWWIWLKCITLSNKITIIVYLFYIYSMCV